MLEGVARVAILLARHSVLMHLTLLRDRRACHCLLVKAGGIDTGSLALVLKILFSLLFNPFSLLKLSICQFNH